MRGPGGRARTDVRARRRPHARASPRHELSPDVVAKDAGRYRAEGLLFHMPGRWQLSSRSRARAGGTGWRATSCSSDAVSGVAAALAGSSGAHGAALAAIALRALDFDRRGRRIIRHGPWPPAGDARSEQPPSRATCAPIALGQRLFFDARLSVNGAVACATCHVPARGWTDGRPRAVGLAAVDRNTPTVLDVAPHRWFSLGRTRRQPVGAEHQADPRSARDGRSAPRTSPRSCAAIPPSRCLYGRRSAPRRAGRRRAGACRRGQGARRVPGDGALGPHAVRRLSRRARARATGRRPRAIRCRAAGRRSLRGQGRCNVCHVGPALHERRVPRRRRAVPRRPGTRGRGPPRGIKQLRADRFNLLGPYSDDRSGAAAVKTRHVELRTANFGQFKTPSLRNVGAHRALHARRPLRDAARRRAPLLRARHGADPHARRAALRPLRLTEPEIGDLIAFLEALTDSSPAPGLPAIPGSICLP